MPKATQPVQGSVHAAGLWGPCRHLTDLLSCLWSVWPAQGSCLHSRWTPLSSPGDSKCAQLLRAACPQPQPPRLSLISLSVAFPHSHPSDSGLLPLYLV